MALLILNNSVHNHDVKMKRGQRPYNDIAEFIIENDHKMTDKEMAQATLGTDTVTPIRRIRYTRNHYIKASPKLMAEMKRNRNTARLQELDETIATQVVGKKVTLKNVRKLQRLFSERDGIELALKGESVAS